MQKINKLKIGMGFYKGFLINEGTIKMKVNDGLRRSIKQK